jgi:hypothetical protein
MMETPPTMFHISYIDVQLIQTVGRNAIELPENSGIYFNKGKFYQQVQIINTNYNLHKN